MNSILENWRRFWSQLGPNQRVSVLFSGFLVIAAMVGLFIWAQRPDMRLLFGSVEPKDAAAIVAELEGQGIPYEMRAGGTAIFVPAQHVYSARMEAASKGLIQGDSVGFEIFDQSSFGISDFVQRTNFIRAVQGELARTIRQLNGVRNARVMVVMPDNRLLLVNKDVKTTASVMVDVGGGELQSEAVRSIQALVANAVEGLTTANVAVVDNRGTVLSGEQDEDGLMGASSNIVEYRQSLENYFSDKVESMLERVVGPGNAVVRVSADIDSKQVSRMEEDFNEDGAVLRRQTSSEDASVTIEGSGGVASMEVEGDEAPQAGGGDTSRTEEETRNREQDYEIDRIVTNTFEGPGAVRRLTASVFIAAATEPPPDDPEADPVVQARTAEELEQLRTMVANALGIALDDPARGSVAIQEVPFSTPRFDSPMTASAPSFDPMQLLQYGEEIIGGLIALILFLVFLSLLKRSSRQPGPLEQMAESRRGMQASRERQTPEMVTPELLNELIQQKPENAGATLRSWLSGGNTNT
jgi:flagellar M-ring protein FliF